MVKIREPLTSSIHRMLTTPTTKLRGKDGRPAFLARAVLAALLATTPEKITNFLSNDRRRKTVPQR
jgi:hypothetical protein